MHREVRAPHLPRETEVTVVSMRVCWGTYISIVQAGVPAVIPLEMYYLDWQESLAKLATLVEPAIAG